MSSALYPVTEVSGEETFTQRQVRDFSLISQLLSDPSVNEILIYGFDKIFAEKESTLSRVSPSFKNPLELRAFVNALLSEIDQIADTRHPMADGVLSDGSRVNIILPPASREVSICIRKHTAKNHSFEDLVQQGAITEKYVQIIEGWIRTKKNFLICGGTGSGKTTLMRALLRKVPLSERVITLEDTPELNVDQENFVPLFTRIDPNQLAPPVTLSLLIRNSLRMRPDRIVVGEVRGEEALFLLDAISTGHPGSMCTLHGNSCAHGLRRLEALVSRAAPQWNPKTIRQLIFDSVHGIVFIEKKAGLRVVSEIAEISSLEEFGFLLDQK